MGLFLRGLSPDCLKQDSLKKTVPPSATCSLPEFTKGKLGQQAGHNMKRFQTQRRRSLAVCACWDS